MSSSSSPPPLSVCEQVANEKTPSNKAMKKAQKEASKLAKKLAKEESILAAQNVLNKQVKNIEEDLYGFLPLIQSTEKTARVWIEVSCIDESFANQKIWVRARVQDSKGKGSVCFLTLRHYMSSIQAVLDVGRGVDKNMIKWAAALSLESVVDVYGEVLIPPIAVEKTTQTVELKVEKIYCISKAASELPFQFRDVNKRQEDEKKNEELAVRVNQDTRLDNRTLDLRVPVNLAIFQIVSETSQQFRNFLLKENFKEIHTPKLIEGASEGGANVFTLKYFGRDACLAQSPQLYKQMAVLGGMEKVFEIGSVFRAENSNTYRHLCEFTGMDLEMSFKEHFFEVLDLIDRLFQSIFIEINQKCKKELAEVQRIYPSESFLWLPEMPKFDFCEAIDILRKSGLENIPDDLSEFDLSTDLEKAFGKIVRSEYKTDFYAIVRYPLKVRAFYSMPCPDNDIYSNSYDVFMRGEEILSGAQRIHDAVLLEKRAKDCGIDVRTIQSYIDSFKLGSVPHAGCGVGLERVVMLFLGLNNIRKTSLFPRDPKRLTP